MWRLFPTFTFTFTLVQQYHCRRGLLVNPTASPLFSKVCTGVSKVDPPAHPLSFSAAAADMNRRTLLLAAAVGLAAVLLGSAALPAVGGVLGAWRLSTVGYRLMNLVGSGRFELVHGVKKDVYRCGWQHPGPTGAGRLL